jgi:hypothetical protein
MRRYLLVEFTGLPTLNHHFPLLSAVTDNVPALPTNRCLAIRSFSLPSGPSLPTCRQQLSCYSHATGLASSLPSHLSHHFLLLHPAILLFRSGYLPSGPSFPITPSRYSFWPSAIRAVTSIARCHLAICSGYLPSLGHHFLSLAAISLFSPAVYYLGLSLAVDNDNRLAIHFSNLPSALWPPMQCTSS